MEHENADTCVICGCDVSDLSMQVCLNCYERIMTGAEESLRDTDS